MRRRALFLAVTTAVILPRWSHADSTPAPLRASVTCEAPSGPGRFRCDVELRVVDRRISWADVDVVATDDFILPLRGRLGPHDASTHDADIYRWSLGFVARDRSAGKVVVRVHAVLCDGGGLCARNDGRLGAGGRRSLSGQKFGTAGPPLVPPCRMLLPGRLRQTTLGDLLGSLHRARAHGTLELAEDLGRTHRVHIADGMIVAVEFDGAAATLAEVLRTSGEVDDGTLRRSLLRAIASKRLHGEVLVQDFRLSETVVDAAVRRQMTARLSRLEQLVDARVHFRVTLKAPRGAVVGAPLPPSAFLTGRRRFRDHGQGSVPRPPPARPTMTPRPREEPNSAFKVLGVAPGADATEIKRAYRRLARTYHPDLHPDASEPERRILAEHFSVLTTAYRSLVA